MKNIRLALKSKLRRMNQLNYRRWKQEDEFKKTFREYKEMKESVRVLIKEDMDALRKTTDQRIEKFDLNLRVSGWKIEDDFTAGDALNVNFSTWQGEGYGGRGITKQRIHGLFYKILNEEEIQHRIRLLNEKYGLIFFIRPTD